jgi:hypothetical protein
MDPLAMLQDQHDKQIKVLEHTNKVNMEAIIEQVNALIVTAGGNKGNTPSLGGNSTGGNK